MPHLTHTGPPWRAPLRARLSHIRRDRKMIRFRVMAATLLGCSAAACADAVGPEARAGLHPRAAVIPVPYKGDPPELPAPTPPPTYTEATPEDIAKLPPEYQAATLFLEHRTLSEFRPGQAVAEGSMRWRGNRGRQELTMTLRGTDGTFERTFTSAGGGGWPWTENQMNTTGAIQTLSECGNVLDASTKHEIWNEAIAPEEVTRDGAAVGWWRWGTQEKTTFDPYPSRQPGCTDQTTGGTKPISNPDDGSGFVCRTITVEHYWYYPETGAYEYRYTTTRTECRPVSSS